MMIPGIETPNSARKASGKSSASEPAESIVALREELDSLRRDHSRLQQAVYEAAQIQRRLCAPRELVCGEFEVAGEIFPVRHLSGDFFKVMKLDSMLGMIVGDIAGKGMTAGIWQAHLMDLIERCARTCELPANAVAAANRDLCRDQNEPPIAGLFFAKLDPASGELEYCNAGLPPPLLLRRDKTIERLEEGGPMLGALQESVYKSGKVRLNPGDMLLAYSDGLTECRNAVDEEFETERLAAAAKAISGGTANQVLFSTLGTVLDFADGCAPGDDLTLLVVRRREGFAVDGAPSANKTISGPRRRKNSDVRARQAGSNPETSFEN